MVFSYKEKLTIKYFWIKYKCGATRTVTDYPEHEWKINIVNTILKITDETSDIVQKEGFDDLSLYGTKISQKIILHQQKFHLNLMPISLLYNWSRPYSSVPWGNPKNQSVLIEALKSAWPLQEGYCQSIIRKYYKLHSSLTKRCWKRNTSITYTTMWYMFKSWTEYKGKYEVSLQ